jgi:Glycosyl transferase family 2
MPQHRLNQMHSRPLISILVATRNRQQYAAALVSDILSWADARLEVIVEDNSDDDGLSELLGAALSSGGLHYRYNNQAVSSIDNFNNTIAQSSGEFVCLVGDDDGVNPAIVEVAAWALKHGIDCVTGNVRQEYIWPVASQQRAVSTGELSHPMYSGHYSYADLSACRRGLAERGGTRYLELPFPRLYHGLVRRSLLERVKEKTGQYLGGLSPDIYSAVALSALSQATLHIDYPLTIPGVCPASTTATEGKGAAQSTDVRHAPHFRSREWYQFSDRIPPVYCVDAIWADSALAAMTDMGMKDDIAAQDVDTLCAYIFRTYPSLRPTTYHWHRKHGDSRGGAHTLWKLFSAYLGRPLQTDLTRVRNKLVKHLHRGQMRTITDINDIAAARKYLEKHLDDANLGIGTVLDSVVGPSAASSEI